MNKERRKNLLRAVELIVKLGTDLEEIHVIISQEAEAEREYYDNMPENMQSGDKGQQADNAATQLEEVLQFVEDFDTDEILSKIEDART